MIEVVSAPQVVVANRRREIVGEATGQPPAKAETRFRRGCQLETHSRNHPLTFWFFTPRGRSQTMAAMPDAHSTQESWLGPTLARASLWMLLGGWFGAYLLFGAIIVPIAFAVLPTTAIAGSFIAPVLTKLHLFGALAGLPLALLSKSLGRGRLLVAIPIVLSLTCLYSHFGLSVELAEIRDLSFGPEGNPDVAARFDLLHRISLGLFVSIGAAITGLIVLNARADAETIHQ